MENTLLLESLVDEYLAAERPDGLNQIMIDNFLDYRKYDGLYEPFGKITKLLNSKKEKEDYKFLNVITEASVDHAKDLLPSRIITFLKQAEKSATFVCGTLHESVFNNQKLSAWLRNAIDEKKIKFNFYICNLEKARERVSLMNEINGLNGNVSIYALKEYYPVHCLIIDNQRLTFELPHNEEMKYRVDCHIKDAELSQNIIKIILDDMKRLGNNEEKPIKQTERCCFEKSGVPIIIKRRRIRKIHKKVYYQIIKNNKYFSNKHIANFNREKSVNRENTTRGKDRVHHKTILPLRSKYLRHY